MLSEYIDHTNPHSVDFADYSSFKYFNYLSMKSFGMMNQFQTFGIYPEFSDPDSKNKLQQIIAEIVNSNNIKDSYQFWITDFAQHGRVANIGLRAGLIHQ